MGFAKVANYTGSNETELDVDLTQGAFRYWLIGELTGSNDPWSLDGYITDDAFVSVYNGASDYMSAAPYASGAGTFAAAGEDPTDRLRLAQGTGNAAGEHVNVFIDIVCLEDAGRRTFVAGYCAGIDDGGFVRQTIQSGFRVTAGADNGIRLSPGAFFDFDLKLYAFT